MIFQIQIVNGVKTLVPVSGDAVANSVESGNTLPVTSNAVASLFKKVEFSGTTDSIGEIEITGIPTNSIILSVVSKTAGNVKMEIVEYNLSGTRYLYVQVFDDTTNTLRTNFSCSGIINYIEL